jgi:hypothetical protein
MAREIYSQDVFEKQINGTVFHKEGRLQDFPYAGEGIFESWRYSFDAGKQIFRATNSNKVFEKRIIKDIHGNPSWTTWVEIPDAEAHGIQAIAINDRPLQLPNTDGAIKLQITPQMINTYTKEEIYSIVAQKIDEQIYGGYVYVKWIAGSTSSKDVLEKTYPDGGIIGTFYLVEQNRNTQGVHEKAEYFIWAENSVNKFDWVQIDNPDMRAYVSYPVFDEHTGDFHFHLEGDHERQAWNAASGLLYNVSGRLEDNYDYTNEKVSGLVKNISELDDSLNSKILVVDNKLDSKVSSVYDRIEEEAKKIADELGYHVSLIGERNSPHVTFEERLHWNAAFTNSIRALPDDGNRYVALNNGYQKAFEQAKTGVEEIKKVFDSPSVFVKSGQPVLKNMLAEFNLIFKDSTLTGAQLEIGGLNTQGDKIRFETVGDIDGIVRLSEDYSTGDTPIWKVGNKAFDEIIIVSDDKEKSFTLTNIKLYLKFKKIISVELGDQNLPLNLIGVDRTVQEPTYNGESIFNIATEKVEDKLEEFNKIISVNEKNLNDRLSDLLKYKVNIGPDNARYDVRGNSLIKSLIQTNEVIGTQVDVVHRGTTVLDVAQNGLLISGFKARLAELKNDGKTPYNIELIINHANTTGSTIYFNTDNPIVRNSPTVKDNRFDANWPGVLTEEFDKIYVKDGTLKILSGGEKEAKLIISYFRAGDTALVNEEFKLNWIHYANRFELTANEDAIITAEKNLSIIVQDLIQEVKGSNNISVEGDESIEISGDQNIKVKGDRYQLINNETIEIEDNREQKIGGNDTIKIEGDRSITTEGNEIIEVKGDRSQIIDGTDTIDIEGDRLLSISGNEIIDIKGDITTTIHGNEIINVGGDRDLIVNGNTNIKVNGGEVIEIENRSTTIEGNDNLEVKETLKVDANIIDLGVKKDYDDDTVEEQIKVYGQEIDERYAPRDLFEEVKEDYYDFKEETETNIAEINKDLASHQTQITEISGLLEQEITDREEAIQDTVDKLSDDINAVAENAAAALSSEVETRENEDEKLQKQIDAISGLHHDHLDNYYTKVESDDRFYNKTEVYNKTEIYNKEEVEKLLANTKTITLTGGDQVIELDDEFNIYQFLVNAETNIFFKNIKDGKEYKFYFDQGSHVHQFAISNPLHNAYGELQNTKYDLEHLSINSRTVIHAVGRKESDNLGFIITTIIPKVISGIFSGFNIVLGNTKGKIYGTTNQTVEAVRVIAGVGSHSYSNQILIDSEYINGEAWINGKWTLSSDRFIIKEGKIGEESIFYLTAEQIDYLGANNIDTLTLDFSVTEALYTIWFDTKTYHVVDQATLKGVYLNDNLSNQRRKYQPVYNEVLLHFSVKDDFFLDEVYDNMGNRIYRTMPWKFIQAKLPPMFEGENKLIITPEYFVRIKKLDEQKVLVDDEVHMLRDGVNKVTFLVLDPNNINPPNNSVTTAAPDTWANAPITITDYDETKMKVIGPYDPDTHSIQIELIGDWSQLTEATFTARTLRSYASDGSIQEYAVTYHIPAVKSAVITGRTGINEGDNGAIRHMTARQEVDYNYFIKWNNGILSLTNCDGTWEVDDPSIATIRKTGRGDTAILTTKKKGIVTIKFTHELDTNNPIYLDVEVCVHPHSLKIDPNPINVVTNSIHPVRHQWYGLVDTVGNTIQIDATELTDWGIAWAVTAGQDAAMFANQFSNNITLLDKEIVAPDLYNVAKIIGVSNMKLFNIADKTVGSMIASDEAFVHITAGFYMMSFTSTDPNFLGVSNYAPTTYQKADSLMEPRLLFKNGFVIHNDSLQEIRTALGSKIIVEINIDGTYKVDFNMPYKNLVFDIKAQGK